VIYTHQIQIQKNGKISSTHLLLVMDPLTGLVLAILGGAAANLLSDSVRQGSSAVKRALQERFKGRAEAQILAQEEPTSEVLAAIRPAIEQEILNDPQFKEDLTNLITDSEKQSEVQQVGTPDPTQAQTHRRIFISYRSKEPDIGLAHAFYEALLGAKHVPFMAEEIIGLREDWPKRIDQELEQSDYLLLLLSNGAATSEMVIEVVRRARELCGQNGKPQILPIQVCLGVPLNYQLRSYLEHVPQERWRGSEDTQRLVSVVLNVVGQGISFTQQQITEPEVPEFDNEMRPLPEADLEFPTGVMKITSPFYVERDVERPCYRLIEQESALLRIKAPRQMGKTSLLARLSNHARQQGYRTPSLSFQLWEASSFGSLNLFLRRFCALVGRQLGVSSQRMNESWDEETYDSVSNCTHYFEEYILSEQEVPIVLSLDEVDQIFPYEKIAQAFFPMLRGWNELSKNNDLWKKLRLIVVHSTEVYVHLDGATSPFGNVGYPVILPDFTPVEMQALIEKHDLAQAREVVVALAALLGGHPFLVRLALYHLALKKVTLAELLRQAPTEAGYFKDHLRRHLWNLQQHPDLLQAMKQVS